MTDLEKAKVICERFYFPKELTPEVLMETLGNNPGRTAYIEYMYNQATQIEEKLIRTAIGAGFIDSWRMYKAKKNGN